MNYVTTPDCEIDSFVTCFQNGQQKQSPLNEAMKKAALDVLAERRRQIDAEGWTTERDDSYINGELSDAAASYALNAGVPMRNLRPPYWPWDSSRWKPSTPRRDLVKAAALIIAEIERLDRIQPTRGEG